MEEAIRSKDVDAFKTVVTNAKIGKSAGQETEIRIDVERELRRYSLQLAAQNASDNDLKDFLCFVIECSRQDLCARAQVAVILQDLFDIISVEKSERLFFLIEDLIPVWKSVLFFEPCRNLVLRLCNDLLKRLSRTVQTGFCGRILVFLARCLPLTEKSGLNLVSQFNTDNVTRFSDQSEQTTAGSTEQTGVDMEEGEMHDSHIPVDYALYCKFWQLQAFFSSPATCYDRASYKKFQHNCHEVLTALASYKLEDVFGHGNAKGSLNSDESGNVLAARVANSSAETSEVKLSNGKKRRSCFHPKSDGCSTYFAKYLTSQKLLQLQLNDSQFRRYFLTQCLILFQYLTADLKCKDAKKQTLSDDQVKWLDDMTEKCYKLLSETHPDGNYFAKVVKHLLQREEHWSDWKNRGCPDFTAPVSGKDKMNVLRKRPKLDYDTSKLDLGNSELTKLWTIEPNNLSACRSSQRAFIPDLQLFLQDPFDELDPDQQVTDEYKSINQELFQWRACRLLSVASGQFFQTGSLAVHARAATPTAKDFRGINDFLAELLTKTAHTLPKLRKMAEEKKEHKKTLKKDEEDAEIGSPPDDMEGDDLNDVQQVLLSERQIKQLVALISRRWEDLAKVLDFSNDTIASFKKKSKSEDICELILSQWAEGEGDKASVRRLRNLLLQAELFDEQVASVLTNESQTDEKTSSNNANSTKT